PLRAPRPPAPSEAPPSRRHRFQCGALGVEGRGRDGRAVSQQARAARLADEGLTDPLATLAGHGEVLAVQLAGVSVGAELGPLDGGLENRPVDADCVFHDLLLARIAGLVPTL